MIVKKKKAAAKKTASADFDFELPTQPSEPPKTLLECSSLFFGESGVGKTSTIAALGEELGGNVLMLAWEASDESIRCRRTPVLANDVTWPRSGLSGWEKGLRVAEVMAKEAKKENYVAVCNDTGAPAFERCLEYVCQREHIQHPGLMDDYGASWKKVRDEFKRYLEIYRSLGLAVFTITHETLEAIETRGGRKYFLVRPALSGKVLEYFKQSTAVIGYIHKMKSKRYMQIAGDEFVLAKGNPQGHFMSTSGSRVERIPLGNTGPQDAAKSIIRAWNNKQKGTYDEAQIMFTATQSQSRSGKVKFSKPEKQVRSS